MMKSVSLKKAVSMLKAGEVVAFPTETVYGLGADAWNPDAIRKVFQLKGRPSDNPLIVHLANRNEANQFAASIPDEAKKLMEAYWPGPLTLIFPKRPEVLDIITGGMETVALRCPDHPIANELLLECGPLVAPSANKSGRPSPTRAEHVYEDFGENVYVLEGGTTQIGLESTVLDVSRKPFTIYRPGFISKRQIEEVIGKNIRDVSSERHIKSKSPGTRYTHYAPNARVRWMEPGETAGKDKSTLYLLHSTTNEINTEENTVYYNNNLEQFAQQLYDRFREADNLGYLAIAIEPLEPETENSSALLSPLRNRIAKAIGK
jgi:L-threonylcarbamoyladenylate synthase